MRNVLSLLFISLVLISCGGGKKAYKKVGASKVDRIVQKAQSYAGTKYKYGGTTRNGMDCSGLVYVAFQKENIVLPRISRDMAKKGKAISERSIKKGDLVFFKTNKSSRKINHVGLVTAVNGGEVFFMHATTSRGVMTSSLNEKYWRNAFAQARRVL